MNVDVGWRHLVYSIFTCNVFCLYLYCFRDTSSRVRVMQVVEEVTAGASFTFDYALFVLCAAFIAGVGLATDSSATVIASMLFR